MWEPLHLAAARKRFLTFMNEDVLPEPDHKVLEILVSQDLLIQLFAVESLAQTPKPTASVKADADVRSE